MFGLLVTFAAILPQGCQPEVVAGAAMAAEHAGVRWIELDGPIERPRTTHAGSRRRRHGSVMLS